MKFEFAIIIAIVWFIIRAVSKANKRNKEKLQRGDEFSNNSANTPTDFTNPGAEAALARARARSSEGHSLERTSVQVRSLEQEAQDSERNILDPFLEAKSLEDNPYAHYNETTLVQEVEVAHETGTPVPHHRHQLFDEKKDRSKAISHQQSTASQTSGARDAKTATAKSRTKHVQRNAQAPSAVAGALKSPQSLKQAFILSEILQRPEF